LVDSQLRFVNAEEHATLEYRASATHIANERENWVWRICISFRARQCIMTSAAWEVA
jgi:hypothetical protein